jgi:serine/threonine-protein kinase
MSTSEAIDHGRFAPGDVILDRYRIIGRLGKGGMGEVFRADDLRLGQPGVSERPLANVPRRPSTPPR